MGKSEAKFRANLFASNGDMELYKLREAIRLEVRVLRPTTLNEIPARVNIYIYIKRKRSDLRFSCRVPLTCQVWRGEGESAKEMESSQ